MCQRGFPNILTSICIVADVGLQLEFGQSETKFVEIISSVWFFLYIAISYFVVHPTVPFGRDLRCIIGHMDVWCIFNPSITSIEVVIVFKIFITIFIRSNQFTNFQFIKPGISKKMRLAYLWIVYCVTLHNHNTLSTQCIKCHINLPIQFEQTVSDTTIEFDNFPEFEYFIHTQNLR